jgi:prepilin-type N-terminal cleavage/methylation domain-containing protein/prepilin-type processing-associated H-X9-DG protein
MRKRVAPAGGPPIVGARGFSLVELLVVIALVGMLIGMLLPAVQRVRESARKTACGNNLRQTALAVCTYESGRRWFPAGCDRLPALPALPAGTLHAWTSSILPFLEEAALAARIDYAREWNDPAGNRAASKQKIPAYVCPSGVLSYVGKADYSGISGAWMLGVDGVPFLGAAGLTNGVLVPHDRDTGLVRAAHVSDGLSGTLLAAESTDRGPAPGEDSDPEDSTGRWAVHNCGPQSSGFINTETSDIRSLHPGGAQAAFADGRVMFLGESMDPVVLAAICTRNGGEAQASAVNVP